MQIAWLNDQQPLLSVFVADGAGSVSQGGEGAMLAVNEAMAYMSQKVQGGELGLNDVLATNMVLTIRQRLFAEAGNDSNLLIVFYVQIMPDDFVMQLHRF